MLNSSKMCSKYMFLVLTCFLVFYTTNAQILLCTYRTDYYYGYTCDVFIYNPSGTYNFSRISGTHLSGKTNEDVRYIRRTDDSNTTNVPYIICETFQNATSFFLGSIRISRIDENSFWGCKSLNSLYLSNNLLTSLPLNAFSTHSPSYTNKISELPWDMYGSHLQNLVYLYLYNNQIQEILPNTFSSLTSLTTLDLDDNQIKEVLPLTFNSLVNLKTLRLNNNKIIKLNAKSFESMEKLTELQLEDNQIEEIPPGTFSSLINLVELSLSSNNISIIFSDSFESLEKLTYLSLNHNQIEELPKNAFSSLKQLLRIDLYNNKLKVIHSLGILPKLTKVFLEDNQIDAFDQDLIDDTGVTTLDMSNNLCANFSIIDSSASRQQMRMQLLKCFENYANLQPETTTILTTTSITTESSTTEITLPPGCIGGSLDERVCRLEDLNEDFQDKFYNQNLLNNEFHADLKNQSLLIVDMQENFKNQSNAFSSAIEELEKRIDELANRPCACN